MQGNGMKPAPLSGLPDQALWQHSRTIDLAEDEAARYLDLAGFADELLDPDERERVAEWLARDPAAASDVAAARSPVKAEPLAESVFARASALIGTKPPEPGSNVIPFRRRQWPRLEPQGMARWGSLVAAAAVASWLGLTLGIDTSRSLAPIGRTADEGFLNEMIDPPSGFMRELTDGRQT